MKTWSCRNNSSFISKPKITTTSSYSNRRTSTSMRRLLVTCLRALTNLKRTPLELLTTLTSWEQATIASWRRALKMWMPMIHLYKSILVLNHKTQTRICTRTIPRIKELPFKIVREVYHLKCQTISWREWTVRSFKAFCKRREVQTSLDRLLYWKDSIHSIKTRSCISLRWLNTIISRCSKCRRLNRVMKGYLLVRTQRNWW